MHVKLLVVGVAKPKRLQQNTPRIRYEYLRVAHGRRLEKIRYSH
jgi:hypothetical protein